MRNVLIGFLILIPNILYSQISWTVNDSIEISPEVCALKGRIDLNLYDATTSILPDNNELIINLKNKYIDFISDKNLFRLQQKTIRGIDLDGFKYFQQDELFNIGFSDTILKFYRKKIYNELDLNIVEFSSSKKLLLDLNSRGELYLKNQKVSTGKICSIGMDFIQILKADGDLDLYKDGDFNFLMIGSVKLFNCKSLYDLFFREFTIDLKKKISNWEKTLLEYKLEDLVNLFGPINNILELSGQGKMITWEKKKLVYNLDIQSSTAKTSVSWGFGKESITENTDLALMNLSKIFLYGNSFRSLTGNSMFGEISTTNSKSYQFGKVVLDDEGFNISVLFDNTWKVKKVFHNNIFSEPNYGLPFRFTN